MDAQFEPGSDGRSSVMTLRLEGPHDIFRFAVNMLHQQVEFGAAGRAMLVELRDHLTPDRFDPMARSLLGDDRYAKLRDRFERDRFCSSCDKELKPGAKFAAVSGARALCKPCATRWEPDLAMRVVPAEVTQ
jgi:hypothetical protein